MFSQIFSLIILHGLPNAITLSGMFRVTILPAPITTLLPIETPGRIIAPPPIHTLEPIFTGAVRVLQNGKESSCVGVLKRSAALVG